MLPVEAPPLRRAVEVAEAMCLVNSYRNRLTTGCELARGHPTYWWRTVSNSRWPIAIEVRPPVTRHKSARELNKDHGPDSSIIAQSPPAEPADAPKKEELAEGSTLCLYVLAKAKPKEKDNAAAAAA